MDYDYSNLFFPSDLEIILNMRIIIGLILMGVGFLIVWKSEWLLQNFGRLSMFEGKFAMWGGTRMGYKLSGVVFLFVGILAVTNLHARVINALVSLLPGIGGGV